MKATPTVAHQHIVPLQYTNKYRKLKQIQGTLQNQKTEQLRKQAHVGMLQVAQNTKKCFFCCHCLWLTKLLKLTIGIVQKGANKVSFSLVLTLFDVNVVVH